MSHYPGCPNGDSAMHPADCKACFELSFDKSGNYDFEFWEQNNDITY